MKCTKPFLLMMFLNTVESLVLQQTTPFPVCPGDDIIFTCTVTPPGGDFLWWYNPDNETDFKLYYPSTNNQDDPIVGIFTTVLVTGGDDMIVSTAKSPGITVQDDTTQGIACKNQLGEKMPMYIMLSAAPSAPVDVSSSAMSVTSVLLSWSPPSTSDTSCPPTTYTITITAASLSLDPEVIKITDTTTNKTVSGLNPGQEYSFTVAGVDAGGRVGENSYSASMFTLDTPQAVIGLQSSVLESTIAIKWMPPPPSSRPPVTGYKISHDTTGSVLVNQTSNTTFTIEGVAPGVYLFTVLAVNLLGDGEEKSVTAQKTLGNSESTIIGIACALVGISVIILLIAAVMIFLNKKHSAVTTNHGSSAAESKAKDSEVIGVEYDSPEVMTGVEYDSPEVMTGVQQRVEVKQNVAYGNANLNVQENVAYGCTSAHDMEYI